MRQVLANLKDGEIELAEIPRPQPGPGQLLIRTRASAVSAGTERMLVEFGNAGWIEKARQQPDKVRMVLDKIRTDGIAPTIEAVMRKLDQPIAMGYCNVGEVVEVGAGVRGFAPGDRVASNGKHAEFVAVPMNLCAKVPDGVPDECAAFTVLGAVALQGLRLAQPTLGESFAVIGLGLVGLMTVQLLRAQGCRVIGIDPDRSKAALARRFGAEAVDMASGEDAVQAALRFSRGAGIDGVIIAASTPSSDPVHQAALMSRKRGRIVLVGVTGLELSRADFYEKELSFQVSCSYGPGRYDPEYEEKARDYPIGYVRWTEQRNFVAVLDLVAQGRLDLAPLISHRFPISEAGKAYALLQSDEPSLGVLLTYPSSGSAAADSATTSIRVSAPAGSGKVGVGFIGAGNYAGGTLIPAFRLAGARLKAVASASGVSGTVAARKNGIELSATDAASLVADPDIGAIVVSTRHRSHALWACEAIAAGKHVFVEKPLAMTLADIERIEQAYLGCAAPPLLMVGFNRRFAPHVIRMHELLSGVTGPKSLVMTVNAGAVPRGHWTQDAEEGGGRILGEACHFIDLLRFLAGSPITQHQVNALRENGGAPIPDTANIELAFADGSIGAIHYIASGHKGFSKERLEVFGGGKVLRLDNFRSLEGFGWPGFRRMRLWRQDKGNAACVAAFVHAIENGASSPIPFDELMEVSRVAVQVSEAL